MAQPIPMDTTRDPRRELVAKLEAAPQEHAAALLESYELLQTLHDHGILTILRGTLGAGTKIVATASEGANTPEAIRAIRNLLLLSKMLGSIEPDLLASLTAAAGESLSDAKQLSSEPPGLFATVRMLGGREVRLATSWMVAFLRRLAFHICVKKQ